MAIQWTEAAIEEIVRSVMREVNASAPLEGYDAASYCGRRFIGVYEDMKDAIAAAEAGYRAIREMRVEEREKLMELRKKMNIPGRHPGCKRCSNLGTDKCRCKDNGHKHEEGHVCTCKSEAAAPKTGDDLVAEITRRVLAALGR